MDIGFVTKEPVLGEELRFWEIEDDQKLEDFLFGDLLAGLYPDADWESLPEGYYHLVQVLEFERHCQFEGWTTVSNKGAHEMRDIIQSYPFVGLPDEANALAAVTDAYAALASDDDERFHDALNMAHSSVPNRTPEIEDRLPVLFAFVRNNPRYFGVDH